MTRSRAAGIALLPILALAISCASSGPARSSPASPVELTGVRVHQSATNRTVSFRDMVAAAARADIVFFGEQHDDPETHFAEFALLEGIGRLRSRVVLSLEMFERDVQPAVDDYFAGRISETEFLAKSQRMSIRTTDTSSSSSTR